MRRRDRRRERQPGIAKDSPKTHPTIAAPPNQPELTASPSEGWRRRTSSNGDGSTGWRCVTFGREGDARADVRGVPAGLTDREVNVLRLVARGGTNKDVARALSISHRTVQHHVAHINDKVGVTSRAGAALFAAQHGLTGPGTSARA